VKTYFSGCAARTAKQKREEKKSFDDFNSAANFCDKKFFEMRKKEMKNDENL
jgi:hypothetical protein